MQYRFEKKGRFTVVHITGNIDTAETTRDLDHQITAMIAEGHLHFVFNLDKTTYLDSAGISVFIHCLCYVQEKQGSIFIVAQDNQVKRVLDMVGINRLIVTFDSLDDFFAARQVARGGDDSGSPDR